MDEWVDILNSDGSPTGETALKAEAHRKGLFHPTAHVWFYTGDARVLIQQRAEIKDTYPLLWDVSVAGHCLAGEKIETSAVREIQEEIGLKVKASDLQKIGIYKSVHHHGTTFIDCEFHHTFISELHVPLKSLQCQKSEVAALKLISLLTFSEETWGLSSLKNYVPHGPEYYKTIVKEIKNRLTF